MNILWIKAKKYLAVLWFIGGGMIFFIMLIQTILGKYEEHSEQAWGWFLPTIIPTLSLIIGVFVMDNTNKEDHMQTCNRFLFRLSFILSFMYLIVVFLTIAMQPFSAFSSIELMKKSSLWLGPFQGLVSASLGAFFIQKK